MKSIPLILSLLFCMLSANVIAQEYTLRSEYIDSLFPKGEHSIFDSAKLILPKTLDFTINMDEPEEGDSLGWIDDASPAQKLHFIETMDIPSNSAEELLQTKDTTIVEFDFGHEVDGIPILNRQERQEEFLEDIEEETYLTPKKRPTR